MQFDDKDPVRGLTESAFATAAADLDCEIAAIKAVAEVESRGEGFLPEPDVRPKILFERHKFSAFTGRRFDASHSQISNRKAGGYKGGADEYRRLDAALALDEDAALLATSWGRFQIMGFNHEVAGYSTVDRFVEAMKEAEDNHLAAFVEFVAGNQLDKALRRRDWATFARGYNGRDYKKNHYDEKMDAAYRRFAGVAHNQVFSVSDITSLQAALNFLGADAGKIDGLWGPKTAGAVRNFCRACHLPDYGRTDPELLASVQSSYYALGGPDKP